MKEIHGEAINVPKRCLLAEIELPGVPKTTNQLNSMHWAERHRYTKNWKLAVMLKCASHKINGLGLTKVQLQLTRVSSREPDFDGMVGSWKCIIDALVEAKVFIDDRPSVIGSPVFLWEKTSRKDGHIKIRIFQEDP